MMKEEDVQPEVRRVGGRILTFPDLEVATQASFGKQKTALFIHGFTANARYMRQLMHQFAGDGFHTLAFEYPSDRGIDTAAKTLLGLLRRYDADGSVSGNGLTLVCHSMGGLVGRALIATENGSSYVRKLITLGTPHDGTLKSSQILRFLLDWGEHVSGLNPNAFSADCLSAKQLLGTDPEPALLSRLLKAQQDAAGIEYYSISGGLPKLSFGKGNARDLVANAYLQAILTLPNDGLVAEASSNLSGEKFGACAPSCRHANDYVEYSYTNHSYLVDNQTVAMEAVGFARPS